MQTKATLVVKDSRLTWSQNIIPPRSAESRQIQGTPATNVASTWLKASLIATLDGASTYRGRFGNCFQIVSLVQSTFTFIIQQRSAGHQAESVCGFSFPGMIRGIITVLGKIIKPESDVGSKLRVQPHTGQELRCSDTRA